MAVSDMMLSTGGVSTVNSMDFPIGGSPVVKLSSRPIGMARKSIIFGDFLILWSGNALHAHALLEELKSSNLNSPHGEVVSAAKDLILENSYVVNLILCSKTDFRTNISAAGEGVYKHEDDNITLLAAGSGAGDLLYDLSEVKSFGDAHSTFGFYFKRIAEAIYRESTGELYTSKFYGGAWELFASNRKRGFIRIPYGINIFLILPTQKFGHVKTVLFQPYFDRTEILHVMQDPLSNNMKYIYDLRSVYPFGQHGNKKMNIRDFRPARWINVAFGEGGMTAAIKDSQSNFFRFDVSKSRKVGKALENVIVNTSDEFFEWQRLHFEQLLKR